MPAGVICTNCGYKWKSIYNKLPKKCPQCSSTKIEWQKRRYTVESEPVTEEMMGEKKEKVKTGFLEFLEQFPPGSSGGF